jgi:hypothetical protein
MDGLGMVVDLRKPRDAWKTPAKKVEVKASCRYRMGSSSGETASRSMDPITSDAMDTGPTARSRELPSSE